jgi:hypothetical protein
LVLLILKQLCNFVLAAKVNFINKPAIDKQQFDRVNAYEKIAVEFATALVEQRWEDAHQVLTPSLRVKYSSEGLRERLYGMFSGYANGPATRIFFDPEYSMEDWPDKQKDDVGLAYVGVEGDDFVEAVTVVVSQIGPDLRIRDIQWGRP